LALKQGSSTGVDAVDVKFVLAAFQEINQCIVTCVLSVSGTASRPILEMELIAEEIAVLPAVPARLACQKLTVGSFGPRTMEAAILQGLYSLDAQLAEREFARAHTK